MSKIFKRVRKTGQLTPIREKHNHRASDELHKTVVLAAVEADPHSSTREIAREADVSQSTVCRILKIEKFHPFHINLIHELRDVDF